MIHPQPTRALLLLAEERTRTRSPGDSDPEIPPRRGPRRAAALTRIGLGLIALGSRLSSLGSRLIRA